MSFPKYERYKDSGVEWLGEVPEHWESWKVAHAFSSIGSGTTPPSNEQKWYEEGQIPWVTTGELRENIVAETRKYVTEDALRKFTALRIHSSGSLVIAMYGATIGRLGILGINATTNQACCVMGNSNVLDIKFVFYWLQCNRETIVALFSTGGGQPNINQESVTSLRIPAPAIEEQTQIACFLDRETSRIDTLIAEQKRLIALLKEKRQAVISHAVTKGLDSSVPMKNSGVEWLGEVPQHWVITKLKHIVSEYGGSTPSKENLNYWNGSIPWVTPKDMKRDFIDDSIDHVSELAISDTNLSILPEQSVLIVVRGMILLHSIPVAINTVPTTINQDMKAMVATKSLSPEYLLVLLKGIKAAIFEFIDNSAHGTKKLEWERFENVSIPLPDLDEQERIVMKLRSQLAKLDELNVQVLEAMEMLQERRSALISACVTGKIDLRNWQHPPDPEPQKQL
jgi:type I restriction enzyme S subunit